MNRERALQIVLVLVGLIFLVGVYPLMMFLWPSGWRWQPHQPEYEQMILGVYSTLGVFLLIAARRPPRIGVLSPLRHGRAWFTRAS
jgi:hypothetical protein